MVWLRCNGYPLYNSSYPLYYSSYPHIQQLLLNGFGKVFKLPFLFYTECNFVGLSLLTLRKKQNNFQYSLNKYLYKKNIFYLYIIYLLKNIFYFFYFSDICQMIRSIKKSTKIDKQIHQLVLLLRLELRASWLLNKIFRTVNLHLKIDKTSGWLHTELIVPAKLFPSYQIIGGRQYWAGSTCPQTRGSKNTIQWPGPYIVPLMSV